MVFIRHIAAEYVEKQQAVPLSRVLWVKFLLVFLYLTSFVNAVIISMYMGLAARQLHAAIAKQRVPQ